MKKLSRNFFFALAISLAIMAFVLLILAICAGMFFLVKEAYLIFPYHTVLAVVIFWIWLAKRMMSEINDDDDC